MKPIRSITPDVVVVVEKKDEVQYSTSTEVIKNEQQSKPSTATTGSSNRNCFHVTTSTTQATFINPCIQMSHLADQICGIFTPKPPSTVTSSTVVVYDEITVTTSSTPTNRSSPTTTTADDHRKQQQQQHDDAIMISANEEITSINKFQRVSTESTVETTSSDTGFSVLGTVPPLELGFSTKNYWSQPVAQEYHIRGPNYLHDGKKIPSGNFIFPTRGADLFLTNSCPSNVGR